MSKALVRRIRGLPGIRGSWWFVVSLSRREGVNVHILNFCMDTSNPTGLMVAKLLGGMLAYFAEFESHMIGQRKRDA